MPRGGRVACRSPTTGASCAIADTLGARPAIEGASYWADAAFIAAAGIPTVMYGPSGAGAHALEEWVSLSDTEAVARVLLDVARRVCA